VPLLLPDPHARDCAADYEALDLAGAPFEDGVDLFHARREIAGRSPNAALTCGFAARRLPSLIIVHRRLT
jgi:hypothetical protein